jgi:hypothetical protein
MALSATVAATGLTGKAFFTVATPGLLCFSVASTGQIRAQLQVQYKGQLGIVCPTGGQDAGTILVKFFTDWRPEYYSGGVFG